MEIIVELKIDAKKLQKEIEDKFGESFKRAFTRSIEYLYGEAFQQVPGIFLRQGFFHEANYRGGLKADGFIGFVEGGETDFIASYTDRGTGQRGAESWVSYFGEEKPQFTIPIVPLKAKAMHFVNSMGEHIFMKKSKGQKGQAWLRGSLKSNMVNVEKIWAKEFSM